MIWRACRMKSSAKRGTISSLQLFAIIFISRAVVSFTYIQSISVGKFATDILISYAISYFLSLLLSLPAVMCVKKGVSPLDNKFLSAFYAAYYLFVCIVTVNRFSYFAVSKMNPRLSFAVIVIVILAAVGYGAYLGLEPLARFAGFCAVILGLVILSVTLSNIKNFNVLNFYPVYVNSRRQIISNALLFTANTAQPITLLALSKRTASNPVKAYYAGITASYVSVMLLLVFCCAVLGANADLQSFPIFTLFRMASFSDMSRLDILHTSFWIFAVYLKCAVMIFCAGLCVPKMNRSKKTALFTAAVLIVSLLLIYFVGMEVASLFVKVGAVLYVALTVVTPLIYRFKVGKKNA